MESVWCGIHWRNSPLCEGYWLRPPHTQNRPLGYKIHIDSESRRRIFNLLIRQQAYSGVIEGRISFPKTGEGINFQCLVLFSFCLFKDFDNPTLNYEDLPGFKGLRNWAFGFVIHVFNLPDWQTVCYWLRLDTGFIMIVSWQWITAQRTETQPGPLNPKERCCDVWKPGTFKLIQKFFQPWWKSWSLNY